MRHEHILVTGGAGFVGSTFAVGLKMAHPRLKVTALDNLVRRGSELNLPRLREHDVGFLRGDVRRKVDIEAAGGFDLLIECSAEPSVLAGYDSSPAYVVDTNLVGACNCFEVARERKADVLFLSSSRVYPIKVIQELPYEQTESRLVLPADCAAPGVNAQGFNEDFPLTGRRSLYGATKLAAELLLAEYIDMYGMRGVVNRCGVIAGPWQMGKIDQGIVAFWLSRHLFGGQLSYIGYGGTGKQVRDLIHVQDLFDLIMLQINDMDTHNGATYNVGGGLDVSVSLRELTALCVEVVGRKTPITSTPETRKADIPYYVTDHSRVTTATGWRPRRDVKEIIRETADWMTANVDALRPIFS